MFVQDASLDNLFDLFVILCENGGLGDPFEVQWASKSDPKSTKWCKNNYI